MASTTQIANMALAHLGNSKLIASLTENSDLARSCNAFYETARDKVLEDFNWPFARKFVTLGLVEEDPTGIDDEWSFSYRYPSDCLMARRLISGIKAEDKDTEYKYIIGSDSQGRLIYTDIEDARLEYTKREDDTAKYPISFTLALSYYLAFLIAPRVTAGDPFGLAKKAETNYIVEIQKSRANSFNEQHKPNQADGEFLTARN
jgi:hypothetical protein